MLSIIIPARNEIFLQNTINDLLSKSESEIEIIVVLDGYWPDPLIKDDKRVILIHKGKAEGMRPAINDGVAVARGDYIMKTDGHCMFDEGFDKKLITNCEDNWVVVPRRKRLDAENWCIQDVGKPDDDYEYISYPDDPNDFGGTGLNGKIWTHRIIDRKDILIDDTIAFQGSCWFMKRDYFNYLELMDTNNFGPFWNEAQEIGFKAWLSGGRVVVNKKTWYAHLHKGKKYGRGYHLNAEWLKIGATHTKKWMFDKAWDSSKRIYDFKWLIKKFWPMPGWPDDWRETIKNEK